MLANMPTCWRAATQPPSWPPRPLHPAPHLPLATATTAPARAASAHAATAQQPTQSSKLEGRPLARSIGPGLQLMEQRYQVAEQELVMVAPMDVDAVMDMYIESGEEAQDMLLVPAAVW